MKFQLSEKTRFDRDLMFKTHRDELESLVPYMTMVERVRAEGHERHADGTEVLTHRWLCTREAVPVVIRSMIPPNMRVWVGTARWNPHDFECTWDIEIPGLGQAVTIHGVHKYLVDGSGTRVELAGDFAVHADKIPNLPSLISGPMVMAFEKFVTRVIVQVMKVTHRAVVSYLEDKEM
jgi:hypothetical protein